MIHCTRTEWLLVLVLALALTSHYAGQEYESDLEKVSALLQAYSQDNKVEQATGTCRQEFWMVPCKAGPHGVEYKAGKTLNACLDKCKSEVQCKGVDWIPGSKKCALTKFPGAIQPLSPNKMVIAKMQACPDHATHFEVVNRCKRSLNHEASQCKNSTEFHVVPCQSGPDGHFTRDATTIELCMKTCREVEGCTGFDWLPQKSFCWLSPTKYSKDTDLKRVTVKTMAAVHNCMSTRSHFELRSRCRRDLDGNVKLSDQKEVCRNVFWIVPCKNSVEGYIVPEAKTLDSCKKMCQQSSECKGINWLPAKAQCWLTHQPDKNKPEEISTDTTNKMQKCLNKKTHFELVKRCKRDGDNRTATTPATPSITGSHASSTTAAPTSHPTTQAPTHTTTSKNGSTPASTTVHSKAANKTEPTPTPFTIHVKPSPMIITTNLGQNGSHRLNQSLPGLRIQHEMMIYFDDGTLTTVKPTMTREDKPKPNKRSAFGPGIMRGRVTRAWHQPPPHAQDWYSRTLGGVSQVGPSHRRMYPSQTLVNPSRPRFVPVSTTGVFTPVNLPAQTHYVPSSPVLGMPPHGRYSSTVVKPVRHKRSVQRQHKSKKSPRKVRRKKKQKKKKQKKTRKRRNKKPQAPGPQRKPMALKPGCTKEFWTVPCQQGPKGVFVEAAKSLDICMKMCHDDAQCKGFDWQPSAKRCWAMKDAGVMKPIPADFKAMVNMESCPNKRTHFEAVNRCRRKRSEDISSTNEIALNRVKREVKTQQASSQDDVLNSSDPSSNCTAHFRVTPCKAPVSGQPQNDSTTLQNCLDRCRASQSCHGAIWLPSQNQCSHTSERGLDFPVDEIDNVSMRRVNSCPEVPSHFKLIRTCFSSAGDALEKISRQRRGARRRRKRKRRKRKKKKKGRRKKKKAAKKRKKKKRRSRKGKKSKARRRKPSRKKKKKGRKATRRKKGRKKKKGKKKRKKGGKATKRKKGRRKKKGKKMRKKGKKPKRGKKKKKGRKATKVTKGGGKKKIASQQSWHARKRAKPKAKARKPRPSKRKKKKGRKATKVTKRRKKKKGRKATKVTKRRKKKKRKKKGKKRRKKLKRRKKKKKKGKRKRKGKKLKKKRRKKKKRKGKKLKKKRRRKKKGKKMKKKKRKRRKKKRKGKKMKKKRRKRKKKRKGKKMRKKKKKRGKKKRKMRKKKRKRRKKKRKLRKKKRKRRKKKRKMRKKKRKRRKKKRPRKKKKGKKGRKRRKKKKRRRKKKKRRRKKKRRKRKKKRRKKKRGKKRKKGRRKPKKGMTSDQKEKVAAAVDMHLVFLQEHPCACSVTTPKCMKCKSDKRRRRKKKLARRRRRKIKKRRRKAKKKVHQM